MRFERVIDAPQSGHYCLQNATVPIACIKSANDLPHDMDNLARVNIEVQDGKVISITPNEGVVPPMNDIEVIDLRCKMVLPTFVDLHTHIDKGHTTERSRNPDGSLSGADRSTARDAAFWDEADVFTRMQFSVKSASFAFMESLTIYGLVVQTTKSSFFMQAYAHGTSALRTHLINMTDKQTSLTWPAFAALKKKWEGKVHLQAVSLVVLSFFRDLEAATKLADIVAQHGGLLGAAVCCAERGGDPEDDWTTCAADRDLLLDRIFTLAKERDLDIDFHTDENGNELARGLRYVAQKTIEHGYQGRVVCGHCCSLAFQPPDELDITLELVHQAGITVASLPMVNQWTQDRATQHVRTPRWRGITLLHEVNAAGVPIAMASDNTRDQFFAYGDLDMLEVFNQGCRMAHLDRPYEDWIRTVTTVPAQAMGLPSHGCIAAGQPANLVIFRGRRYSELLSRPQFDRVVIRDGKGIDAQPPDYEELDDLPTSMPVNGIIDGTKQNGSSPSGVKNAVCKATCYEPENFV